MNFLLQIKLNKNLHSAVVETPQDPLKSINNCHKQLKHRRFRTSPWFLRLLAYTLVLKALGVTLETTDRVAIRSRFAILTRTADRVAILTRTADRVACPRLCRRVAILTRTADRFAILTRTADRVARPRLCRMEGENKRWFLVPIPPTEVYEIPCVWCGSLIRGNEEELNNEQYRCRFLYRRNLAAGGAGGAGGAGAAGGAGGAGAAAAAAEEAEVERILAQIVNSNTGRVHQEYQL